MKSRSLFVLLIVLFSFAQVQAQTASWGRKEREVNLILSSVKSYLGTKYKYGGMDRNGIDCSGLIYLNYSQGGVSVPRTAKDQSKFGKNVNWNRLRPGDLVFFKFKQKGANSWHSGIITTVEKNKIRFIHASSSRGVVESDLLSDYYRTNVKGFRRVI